MWMQLTKITDPETGLDSVCHDGKPVSIPDGTMLRIRHQGVEETCEVFVAYQIGKEGRDIETPYVCPGPQKRTLLLSEVEVWTYTFKDFQDDFDKGTFDDIKDTWNWCIDVQKDVRIVYVMGTGAEQCHYRWPIKSGVTVERLESYLKQRFHVDRVLHGVG